MRRMPLLLFGLLLAVGLVITLRQDLAVLARRGGDARLAAGDLQGAAAWYRRAGGVGHNRSAVAGGLGAVSYRNGNYQQALEHFSTALAAARPDLGPSLHYNRGNSAYCLALELSATDRPAAARLFRQAMADYQATLSAEPGARDATANLTRATARLAAVTAEQSHEKASAAGPQVARGSAEVQRPAGSASHPVAPSSKAAAGAAEKTGTGDAKILSGKTRRDMSRSEAERLLNESRGREKPAGPLLITHGHTGSQQPEQDW